MREQGRSKTGIASLPHVKLAPMSAPGPTGERQEHSDAIICFAGAGQRRRLFRRLDIIMIKWAIRDLPQECRFFLNTQLMFLKEKDSTTKLFDDDEWIRSLTEAQEITADVLGGSAMYDQNAVDPKNLWPIQMGEFLRKYVSRRLLALSEGEIAALTTSMQQLGAEGSLTEPLARTKVGEKNCFGMIEWKAVREVASRFLPKQHCGGWMETIGTCPTLNRRGCRQMPKDQGAEQGDVDGPLECTLGRPLLASGTRSQIAESLPLPAW